MFKQEFQIVGTMTQVKIDWMTVTKTGAWGGLAHVENILEAARIASWAFSELGGGRAPAHLVRSEGFYPWVFEMDDTGVQVAVPENLEKQGVRVVFPGRACDNYEDVELTARLAQQHGWRFTRVDVACDITGQRVDYDELEKVLRLAYPGKKRSLGRRSSQTGETLMIGSRSSDNYARFYDKAAQQKKPGYWIRLELEIKGETAKALGAMSGGLLQNAASHFAAWLGDVPHWTVSDFVSWVQHDPERIMPPREVQSDRAVWFNSTVESAYLNWARNEPEQATSWLNKMSSLLDALANMR